MSSENLQIQELLDIHSRILMSIQIALRLKGTENSLRQCKKLLRLNEAKMLAYVPDNMMDDINKALKAKVIYQNISPLHITAVKKNRLKKGNQVVRPLTDKYYPDFK